MEVHTAQYPVLRCLGLASGGAHSLPFPPAYQSFVQQNNIRAPLCWFENLIRPQISNPKGTGPSRGYVPLYQALYYKVDWVPCKYGLSHKIPRKRYFWAFILYAIHRKTYWRHDLKNREKQYFLQLICFFYVNAFLEISDWTALTFMTIVKMWRKLPLLWQEFQVEI